jgi:hypothetical protein
VAVTLGPDVRLDIAQRPRALAADKVGVGACLWDGALLLAGFLAAAPRHRLLGARAVELGAGVGVAGLAAARLGARVVLTDLARVLPLLEENLAANGFADAAGRPVPTSSGGSAEAAELEWGALGWRRRAAALCDPPLDYVLAADCCYVDGVDGAGPSTAAFVAAAAALSGPRTRVLVSFERRAAAVRAALLERARAAFGRVEAVPPRALPHPLRLENCELWEFAEVRPQARALDDGGVD